MRRSPHTTLSSAPMRRATPRVSLLAALIGVIIAAWLLMAQPAFAAGPCHILSDPDLGTYEVSVPGRLRPRQSNPLRALKSRTIRLTA